MNMIVNLEEWVVVAVAVAVAAMQSSRISYIYAICSRPVYFHRLLRDLAGKV